MSFNKKSNTFIFKHNKQKKKKIEKRKRVNPICVYIIYIINKYITYLLLLTTTEVFEIADKL